MPPTIAPVLLLLLWLLEPAATDGVTMMVDWMVVVTIWPLAPVVLYVSQGRGMETLKTCTHTRVQTNKWKWMCS